MPKGQRDYSQVRLSQHALERFVERFLARDGAPAADATAHLRNVLRHAKRLGRNARNGAIAALGAFDERMMVAIIQGGVCTTVLTWPQFQSQMAEFGRARLPRKPKRMIKRIIAARTGAEFNEAP